MNYNRGTVRGKEKERAKDFLTDPVICFVQTLKVTANEQDMTDRFENNDFEE